jgi:predicted DNA-binding transcriptional regulator AlpA
MTQRKRFRETAKVEPLLWRTPQVMAALGIDRGTVDNYVRNKVLPPRVVISRKVKGWLPADIMAWLETKKEHRA